MTTKKTVSRGIAFVAFALCALPSMAVDIISGPTLTMDPNGITPLAGVVELETAAPELPSLRISGDGDSWTVEFPEANQLHYLPVLGMKPNRTYTVELLFNDVTEAVMMATTPPLPVDFPTLSLQVSDPNAMQPGYTLLDCFGRAAGDNRGRYTMIVDNVGDVVWYTTDCAADWKQLRNGNLFRIVASPPNNPRAHGSWTC